MQPNVSNCVRPREQLLGLTTVPSNATTLLAFACCRIACKQPGFCLCSCDTSCLAHRLLVHPHCFPKTEKVELPAKRTSSAVCSRIQKYRAWQLSSERGRERGRSVAPHLQDNNNCLLTSPQSATEDHT